MLLPLQPSSVHALGPGLPCLVCLAAAQDVQATAALQPQRRPDDRWRLRLQALA